MTPAARQARDLVARASALCTSDTDDARRAAATLAVDELHKLPDIGDQFTGARGIIAELVPPENPDYYNLWVRCTCGDDGLREGLAGAVAIAIAEPVTMRLAA